MKSLLELYLAHGGKVSDKWSLYLLEYDRLFHQYRFQPIRLLEIGIQNGGSLELWSEYFPDAERLVGCDINPDCAQLSFSDPRISVIVADANTDEAYQRIVERSATFNLIVDDGSHTSSDIVRTFARYFPILEAGGIFVAEDLHCSYWGEFEGGLYLPHSSISFFKRLADIVNFEHWGHPRDRTALLKGFTEQFGIAFDEQSLAMIHSVTFINSMCVIEKREAHQNLLGSRLVAGDTAVVMPSIADLNGTMPMSMDQGTNRWSTLERAPEEMWEASHNRAMQSEQTEAGLRSQLQESLAKIALLEDKLQTQGRAAEADINALQAEGRAAEARISKLQARNREALTRIDRLEAENQAVTARSAVLEQDLLAVLASTSWKVTSTLRLAGNRLKSAKRLQSTARQGVAHYGLLGAMSKVGQVLKDEGVQGVRRRLNPQAVPLPRTTGYAEWVQKFDVIADADRDVICSRIAAMARQPRISVVMPTYNPPLALLDEAIWSVRRQLYTNWELCIADDASSDPGVRQVLTRHSQEDDRIKVLFRDENGHISRATNSALSLATGEYVALLDNDDLLTEHALYWVAQAILDNPEAGLVYSDEDKLSEDGERFDPYFKCEYNPELMLAHNMICHLGVYRKDLVDRVGGFRTGFEGAQDYDLAFRVLEQLRPEQVVHIPRILYHWRAIPGSTASAGSAKDYAAEAGRRAVSEHLQRIGVAAKVLPCPGMPGANRVRYALPKIVPTVSIIIPTRDRIDLLSVCIESIRTRSTYPSIEIIVVDNESVEDKTAEYLDVLKSQGVVVIRSDEPFNFSRLNNLAAREATGEMLCLMNNDIEITVPEWLDEMVSYACRSEIGCVGARLLYPNNTLQHGGVVIGLGGVAGHSHKHAAAHDPGYCGRAVLHQSFSAVTAACLLVRKAVYNEVNGLDESFAVAFNDVDFCLRVRQAGYRNVWTPYAEMIHHESVSRGYEDNPEKIARFNGEVARMIDRWGDVLMHDPAYSPNLTLDREDFSLAWPPRVESLAP